MTEVRAVPDENERRLVQLFEDMLRNLHPGVATWSELVTTGTRLFGSGPRTDMPLSKLKMAFL
jgi:hypothetical protein